MRWLLLGRPLAGRWKSIVAAYVIVIAAAFAGGGHAAQANSKYAAMVVDGHTGKVLYSRHANSRRYPASLTKIMTLYVLFHYLDSGKISLDTRFVVTPDAASQPPSKIGLKPGQTITVRSAIGVLVTKSANDIAAVVAENIAGSEANFARLMTAVAREIGMKSTVFKNASGLPNNEQVSTARDMIVLARRIMLDFPERYSYFEMKRFNYRGRNYRNHNSLLRTYPGTDGIKTGYTRASGFNLCASVRRGKKHLLAVVFGGRSAGSRDAHMRKILSRALPRATAAKPGEQRVAGSRKRVAALQNFAARAAQGSVAASNGPGAVPDVPLPTRASVSTPSTASGDTDGGYHVQVGAYTNKSDALARLDAVRKEASDVIRGHPPIAVPFKERSLVRARFADFTRTAAESACDRLKRQSINCVVMQAE